MKKLATIAALVILLSLSACNPYQGTTPNTVYPGEAAPWIEGDGELSAAAYDGYFVRKLMRAEEARRLGCCDRCRD